MTLDYSGLPERWRETMRRYFEGGCRPGSFLTSCLRNDLCAAIVNADADSLTGLPPICRWLWSEAPIVSWGSIAKVDNWIAARTAERIEELSGRVTP